MAKNIFARRHAEAVFEIAKECNELERWRADLETVDEALRQSELGTWLENPKIPFAGKRELLERVFPDINPLTMSLLYLLVVRNRLRMFPGLVNEYRQLMDSSQGKVSVEVTSALPLEEADMVRLQAELKQNLNKEVSLIPQVDPSLIGGMRIRIGDHVIDGSVRTRLRNLRRSLVEAGLEV